MIYHIAYFKLQEQVDHVQIEQMIRQTRAQLLKIPETLSVRSGQNLDQDSDWAFFFSIETETTIKLKLLQGDANYLKFLETVIRPNTQATFAQTFELEPGKELKYS